MSSQVDATAPPYFDHNSQANPLKLFSRQTVALGSPTMSSRLKINPTTCSEDLDPEDWGAFRKLVHESADCLIDHLTSVNDGPVWRPVPECVKAALSFQLPRQGIGTAAAFEKLIGTILPYTTGNPHPRFMGWVHGGGTAGGL